MHFFGPNMANLGPNMVANCAADQLIGSVGSGARAVSRKTRKIPMWNQCSAVFCNIKWWISIIWWNPIIRWNAIIWWIPNTVLAIPIILNINVASLAQVQQTSLHPPVWTLTGRQATWGASTSLIHDMMESHHMMKLHHMMTFHHMKTFYLGYDGLQSF